MFETIIFYHPPTNSVILKTTPNERGGAPVFVVPRIGETIAIKNVGSYIVKNVSWSYSEKTIRIICE